MRAHISRIPEELLEFGKSDNVVVTLIINATEADRICNDMPTSDNSAAASKELFRMFDAISAGSAAIREFNAVND